MKRSWRNFIFFVTLVVLLGIGFLKQPLVFTYLINPFTQTIWLIIRMFLMIDQSVYWLILIIAVFILALWMAPIRQEKRIHPTYLDSPHLEDRVAFWEKLLRSADDNLNARLSLQSSLNDLYVAIDAIMEGHGHKDVDLPQSKANLWYRKWTNWERSVLYRWHPAHKESLDSQLQESVNQILDSMETIMEIQNDQFSNHPNDR